MPQTQPSVLRTKERREQIDPAFLYVVTETDASGTTQHHFTNYSEPITVDNLPAALGATSNQVFTNAAIRHDKIQSEAFQFSPDINIHIAVNDSTLADQLVKYFLVPRSPKITATIIRVNHEDMHTNTDLDFATSAYAIFNGEKSGIGIQDGIITFSCKSLARSEKRMLPRFFYQRTCNHNLGDGVFCPVNLESADNKLVTTVTSINRFNKSLVFTETLINSNTIVEGTFQGGLLREMDAPGGNIVAQMGIDSVEDLTGSFRLRLAWISDTLVDTTNTDLEIIRGCNKTFEVCGNLPSATPPGFDVADSFGGNPLIPKLNPITEGIRT